MVKNSIYRPGSGGRARALAPATRTLQDAEGRFISQLVGVLDT
jgi:hypothetical protein